MKTPAIIILAAFVLMGTVAASRDAATPVAAPKQGADKGAPGPDKVTTSNVKKSFQVWAVGPNQQAAVDKAVSKATREVGDYLASQIPGLVRRPSEEYVQKHLLTKADPERLPDKDYKDKEQVWEAWGLTVEITNADFESIQRENTALVMAGRQGERMALLAKIAGLLLALCLVVLGYLALEDKTRGYCSRGLLFGAVTLVVLVGAGLFILF